MTARRVFLVGCPRSRTTVSQTIIAQACDLATMASTNWYLEHRLTRLLNGAEGMSRQDARVWAYQRITDHIRQVTGVVLPADFRLEEALDRLATESGAVGWLEKTPMNILAIPEIHGDIPNARFIHLIRDPAAVVTSLLRRARDNPTMVGSRHQSVQKNNEALWRACVQATLDQHGKPNHLIVDAESIVDDTEAQASRVATFLDVTYRAPDDPGRIRAAQSSTPSPRPWKRDATGPVRRITHNDNITLEPLDLATDEVWRHAQQTLAITARTR